MSYVLWLTGLPGTGKTTLSRAVAKLLRESGRLVEILDGDEVRASPLSNGLGFSREDRNTNVLRIGYVANLLARNGVVVIVACVSPYKEARQRAREACEVPFYEFTLMGGEGDHEPGDCRINVRDCDWPTRLAALL